MKSSQGQYYSIYDRKENIHETENITLWREGQVAWKMVLKFKTGLCGDSDQAGVWPLVVLRPSLSGNFKPGSLLTQLQ